MVHGLMYCSTIYTMYKPNIHKAALKIYNQFISKNTISNSVTLKIRCRDQHNIEVKLCSQTVGRKGYASLILKRSFVMGTTKEGNQEDRQHSVQWNMWWTARVLGLTDLRCHSDSRQSWQNDGLYLYSTCLVLTTTAGALYYNHTGVWQLYYLLIHRI